MDLTTRRQFERDSILNSIYCTLKTFKTILVNTKKLILSSEFALNNKLQEIS